MALTLTEKMVVPGVGKKRMSIWKVTGDGSSYQISISDLKMKKVEAAWIENLTNDNPIGVRVETYDYVDAFVETLELGDAGAQLDNGGEVLLFVIGY
jgi:hypothetical protein